MKNNKQNARRSMCEWLYLIIRYYNISTVFIHKKVLKSRLSLFKQNKKHLVKMLDLHYLNGPEWIVTCCCIFPPVKVL